MFSSNYRAWYEHTYMWTSDHLGRLLYPALWGKQDVLVTGWVEGSLGRPVRCCEYWGQDSVGGTLLSASVGNEWGVCSLENILFEGNARKCGSVPGTVKQLLSLITDWLYFGDGKSSRKQFVPLRKGYIRHCHVSNGTRHF